MIQIQFTGNIGRDCKVSETATGGMITFSVAVNQKVKNANTNELEKNYWINCVLFSKAKFFQDNLKAGVKVLIIGDFDAKLYDSRDGKKMDISCVVSLIEILQFKNTDK